MIKSNKIILLNSFFVAFLYSLVTLFIGYENTTLFYIFLVIGSIGLFFILSPGFSLVYSILFLINPFNNSGLSIGAFLPFLLCFLYFFIKPNLSLRIIKNDKGFINLIRVLFLFTVYQVIVSYLILSDQGLEYLLYELKSWLAIWIVIPVYLIIYLQHKELLYTLTFIVLINMIVYFFSILGYVDLFEVKELNRYEGSNDASRLLLYDLRQITKIFVYLIPIYVIYYFKNKLSLLVIFIGSFVFLSVLLAVLRTEIFYLIMGGVLSVYLGRRYLGKKKSYIKLSLIIILLIFLSTLMFPNLKITYYEVFENSINVFEGKKTDASGEYRKNIQLPVLLDIIYNNLLIGGGKYSISYEKTGHYLLYDIPFLGAFGAYGIFGMILYYFRYIFILNRFKSIKNHLWVFKNFPNEYILLLGMYSYFITMVTFRVLHINIELAFDYGQVEFGLFIGVFFGLTRFLNEKINL